MSLDILDTRDLQDRIVELRGYVKDYETVVEENPEEEVNKEDFISEEEQEELETLLELSEEIPEWKDGVTLINEDDFVDYTKELLEEFGYISKDFPYWITIDWEDTADNVKQDYSNIYFNGNTYLYRE